MCKNCNCKKPKLKGFDWDVVEIEELEEDELEEEEDEEEEDPLQGEEYLLKNLVDSFEDDVEEKDMVEYKPPNSDNDVTFPIWKFQSNMHTACELMEVGFFKTSMVWLTTSQTAKWYGVNDRTVRRWIEDGKIEAIDIGDSQVRYLVKVNTLSRYFDSNS